MKPRGSGMSLARRGRRRAWDPRQLAGLTAFLDFAHPDSVVTGSGWSSVVDRMGGSPAVQATDARRPAAALSTNGQVIATFTDDLLAWPLSAANNGTVRLTYAFWFKLANTTGNKSFITTLSTAGGASANKLNYFAAGSAFRANEPVTDRNAISATFDTGWHFATLEIDCSQATEAAQVIESLDGVAQTVSFSGGTAWPASLASPTGNSLIGATTTAAGTPLVGSIGSYILAFNRQLTAAERIQIMNYRVHA